MAKHGIECRLRVGKMQDIANIKADIGAASLCCLSAGELNLRGLDVDADHLPRRHDPGQAKGNAARPTTAI
jgi:hypothetical protein